MQYQKCSENTVGSIRTNKEIQIPVQEARARKQMDRAPSRPPRVVNWQGTPGWKESTKMSPLIQDFHFFFNFLSNNNLQIEILLFFHYLHRALPSSLSQVNWTSLVENECFGQPGGGNCERSDWKVNLK